MRHCSLFYTPLQDRQAAQFDVFRVCPVCADNGAMTARLPESMSVESMPWQANLALRFAEREGGTILAASRHEGPLPIQKALYPEGRDICHAIVLHPPAGICGGDHLHIDVEVGADAQALLTTPGAGKWYRSAGALAEQIVNLKVSRGGTAEWLPQESIVFAGAQARMRTTVELEAGARYIGVETLCLGRRASGETFSRGALQLATDIRLDGVPLWRERGRIEGGSALLDSPVGLAGFSVCSTVIAAGADVGAETLAACRQATPVEAGAQWGVTAMPNLFVGRYVGHSSEAARAWFVELWRALRPAFIGRDMVVPRIWNT
jgi:urease accessory protein